TFSAERATQVAGQGAAGAAFGRLRRSPRTALRSAQQIRQLVSVLIARESEKRQQRRERGISATHEILPSLFTRGGPVGQVPNQATTIYRTQAVRRASIPHTTRTMIAPTVAPMKPAPSPTRYHPIAWPRKVATKAPTIPSSVVRINPEGSLGPE